MRCRSYHWFAGLALFCFCFSSYAIPVRPYNGKFGKAVSDLVSFKLKKTGVSLSNPRAISTVSGIGSSICSFALRGCSSIAWPALLARVAISGVVAYSIPLAEDALVKWLYKDDGTVVLSGPGMNKVSSSVYSDSIHPSYSDFFNRFGANKEFFFKSQDGSYTLYRTVEVSVDGNVLGPGIPERFGANVLYNNSYLDSSFTKPFFPQGEQVVLGSYWARCWHGLVYTKDPDVRFVRVVYFFKTPKKVSPVIQYFSKPISITQAISEVPDDLHDKKVSSELLASAANALWKNSGSVSSVPWTSSEPITAKDVEDWSASNSSVMPSVGDFFSHSVSDQGDSLPKSSSDSLPSSKSETGSFEEKDANLDDNVSSPDLEKTPTASSILDPLLKLMPDLMNFKVPSHVSTCPTASFDAFGNTYTIDSHCSIIEQNREIIGAMMFCVWSILSLFIFLRT